MDKYKEWDNTPDTPIADGDMGAFHTFTSLNKDKSVNKSIKLDFYIGKL